MKNQTTSAFQEKIMRRCFDLARLAGKNTKHNPQVGAVIVHNKKIIGEGYYEKYGGKHAEINALESVSDNDLKILTESEIYVSLEPCCIHGKTPPCTEALIASGIPRVIISTLDPNTAINGKGVQQLKKNGITVEHGILEKKGRHLIAKFKANNLEKRPYVILKFAQSKDGYIGQSDHPVAITDVFSNTLSHKWRSEVESLLVGTNTATIDNPKLTNRVYSGSSPLRLTIDLQEKIPKTHELLSDDNMSWIFTQKKDYTTSGKNKIILQVPNKELLIDQILQELYDADILSLIVEGGSKLLQSFIDAEKWDEARVFCAPKYLGSGTKAPILEFKYSERIKLIEDELFLGYRDA